MCPRAEKIVHKDLTNRGYEVFLPIKQLVREWRNRQRKIVQVPLFPNYIFVYTRAYELYHIKCLPKVATYVSWSGKPATIAEPEIEGIRRMLSLEQEVTVESRFYRGARVRVIEGLLAGHEGILVRRAGKSRFGIQLNAINQTVFVDISIAALEEIK